MMPIRQAARGVFALLLTLSAAAHALTVQRGPYLQNTQSDKIVLRWRTDSATDSVVRYGASPSQLTQTASVATSVTEHTVTLTGLTAGQRYYYSVGSSSAVHAGGTSAYWFDAAPVAGQHSKDFRIWVLGDAGTANSDQRAVRDAYYGFDNVETDLILMLGDNAYNSGTDTETTNAVFTPYQDMLRNVPLYSTRGNHEASASVYYNAFTLPTAGEAGGVASGTEAYYSFNFGDVHFVCLDSYGSSMSPGAPQYQWLEQDLAANTQKWVIAFWHHPPYSITTGHNSDSESGMRLLRENANPILERYGVDVQLGGHNHSYNRSFYINGHYGQSSSWDSATHKKASGDGKLTPYDKAQAEGAVYVMSGSAGKVGYSIDSHPANVSRHFELGSFVIDVKADRLTGRFLTASGVVKDEFTIVKTGATNRPPVAAFSHVADQLNVQFSDSSSDTDGQVVAWQWQFGDGNVSTAQHPAHLYAIAGSFTVTLTVTDDQGASHTTSKVITVAANPPENGETEPNDSRSAANPVGVSGTTIDALMNVVDDKDFFRIELPPGQTLKATLTPNAASDYDLYVYNSNGKLIGKSERGTGRVDTVSVKNTSSSNTYARYIEVRYYDGTVGSTGSYTLNLVW